MAKRRSKQATPLIIEAHPDSYTGYPFITLLKFRDKHVIGVIDNVTNKNLTAYILDMCGPEGVSEELVVALADKWYSEDKDDVPFSITVSREGMSDVMSSIYQEYDIEHITRVIGPVFSFPMDDNIKVRRRKKKPFNKSLCSKNVVEFKKA